MVLVSKPLFYEVQKTRNICHKVFHPWHINCFVGNLMHTYSTIKGSAKFFAVLYLLQCLSKYKKLTQNDIIPIMRNFSWSLATAMAYSSLFVATPCFFSYLCGFVPYHAVAYITPIISGLGIFLEFPERKTFLASSWGTMFVEGIIKRIYITKLLKRNLYLETLIFMLCNGLLMLMLKMRKKPTKEMWFFAPKLTTEKEKNDENAMEIEKNPCSHDDSCIQHCTKVTMKYISFAYAFSVIKLLLTNVKLLKVPKSFLKETIKMKSLNVVLFFGSYVGVYKAITCYLTRKYGCENRLHSFTGGFLAGASYFILSKYAILASLITVLLKVMSQKLMNTYKLPNIPYSELIFILTNIYLMKTRIFFDDACPRIFINIISSCTDGRSETIYSSFRKIITEILENRTNINYESS
ncbi:hypothetical protein O3M35_009209 [Rhynocoris fuscipes]|uniref:Transmembrane protein 135 n=1 Tax=Rhynocoris fuscipes TaxID=488301 RepID=A0AAW1D5L1_9HEMI